MPGMKTLDRTTVYTWLRVRTQGYRQVPKDALRPPHSTWTTLPAEDQCPNLYVPEERSGNYRHTSQML